MTYVFIAIIIICILPIKKGKKYLVIGGILFALPILTWFNASMHFVEALGTTIFYWFISLLLVLKGLDELLPKGLWWSPGSSDYSGREYERHEHYDANGKYTGYTEFPKK